MERKAIIFLTLFLGLFVNIFSIAQEPVKTLTVGKRWVCYEEYPDYNNPGALRTIQLNLDITKDTVVEGLHCYIVVPTYPNGESESLPFLLHEDNGVISLLQKPIKEYIKLPLIDMNAVKGQVLPRFDDLDLSY